MDEQILQRMLQLEKRMDELQTENQMLRQDMNVLRGELEMLWDEQNETMEIVKLVLQQLSEGR